MELRGVNITGTNITAGSNNPITLLLSLDANNYSGSGSTWPGSVGGLDATLQNTPTYTSASPTYFSFDKNSYQYATIPIIGAISFWTVECWFRATGSLTTQVTSLFGDIFSGPYINYTLAFNPLAEGNGQLKTGFYTNAWHLTPGFSPTQNTWYQVVGTFNGSVLKQYINGSLQASQNTGAVCSTSGLGLRIARRWDESAVNAINYFPGDIAIVKLYTGAMDFNQVTNSWNTVKARFGY